MKRYLISGAMALAFCSMFVGCSDDDEWMSYGEAKMQAFDEAFTKIYGQIDPRQDWGFGTANQARYTRGFSTNHNLWGDPDADGGIWNYKVPPALTERQKLRVKLYFQYNPWLTYEDPHLTDFFVQQVYKGGTSPTASQSAEVYPTGNGGSAVGGQQMDLLTVGTPASNSSANYFDHVNDFNNGDYDGGNTVQVLNTGASTNNYGTDSHPDQITLMLDSKSDCVGYWSSNGATGHNDRCALAGADVIDAWANSAEAKALNIDLGDAVYSTEWNRSFVGLDYDGVSGDNIYKKGAMVNGNWDNNAIAYAKFSDAKQKDYLWDGQKVWSFDEYIAAKGEYFLDKEGNKVPYTINERNMFIGTNSDLSGQSAYITRKFIPAYNREDDVIDLTVIQAKIDEGALPCDGKLYQWTKNVGGRDHVYSDWIVTLTPAEKQSIQKGYVVLKKTETGYFTGKVEYWRRGSVQSGRIFVEDLAQSNRGDIDFNDAVFDAYIYDVNVSKVMKNNDDEVIGTPVDLGTDKYTKIDMLACGGTLQLTVAETEVHSLFGVTPTTMVNTIGSNSVLKQGYSDHNVKTIERAPYYSSLSAIPVVVKVDNKDVLVLNNYEDLGKVPHMICVPIGTPWPQERVAIGPEVGSTNTSDCAFRDFANYVGNANVNPWGSINEGKVYEWNHTPASVPSEIEEMYERKDTTYTGTITSEETKIVEQTISTPVGTLVGSSEKYPHQMMNGDWKTSLVLTAQDFQTAGVAAGKKLRIYGVGYNGNDINWELYINNYLTPSWINASNTPTLATKGYIEFDITDGNLSMFSSDVQIQGQAFNVLAVTVVDASQQGSGSGSSDTSFWTGEESSYLILSKDNLTNVKNGSILRFYGTHPANNGDLGLGGGQYNDPLGTFTKTEHWDNPDKSVAGPGYIEVVLGEDAATKASQVGIQANFYNFTCTRIEYIP